MAVKKGQDLPETNHVIRHVTSGKLRRDDARNILGVRWDGLQPKAHEGLSVNWLEFHDGAMVDKVKAAFDLMSSKRNFKRGDVLAKMNVGTTRHAAESSGKKIRVVYAPIDGNHGHAEIRNMPSEDEGFLDIIASTIQVDDCISCKPLLELKTTIASGEDPPIDA